MDLNGARNYVPVSRQLFDNGFVGLYPQGGILEAESSGGPVQVFIAPQAIPNRAKLMLTALSMSDLAQFTGGVAPQGGTIAGGGLQLQVASGQITAPIQVHFPGVNLISLGYDTNQPPQDAAVALTLVTTNDDGSQAFEVQ